MEKALKIRVSGKVQGVWFRESTRRQAVALGVTGSATNLPNGQVEILCYGAEPQLTRLIDWCRTGPELARVDQLEVSELALPEHPPAIFTTA